MTMPSRISSNDARETVFAARVADACLRLPLEAPHGVLRGVTGAGWEGAVSLGKPLQVMP